MATVPTTARVVVIGAGIVGNSLVHHLARLGWRDIVQIDKGALPNPGGSTGHASNFIFPVDHSREITDLTLDSRAAVQGDGRLHRVRRLRGRPHRGADGGAAPADVVGEGLGHRGASWSARRRSSRRCRSSTPTRSSARSGRRRVGVVDSLRAGTIMRERALETGRADRRPDRRGDRPRRRGRARSGGSAPPAATSRPRPSSSPAACGARRSATMAGAHIPLTPAVHQMISVGPCPQLAEQRRARSPSRSSATWTRFCYERQHGADMEVGSYAHRAILHDPEDIPSIEQAKLSPTEMPFTSDDFDPQLEQAFELMPELLGAEGAEIRYAINGLLSLTRRRRPILGETPEVKGLWSAAAVWIKEGPGVGRAVAEWMTDGLPEIDVAPLATSRGSTRTSGRRAHTRPRTSEAFIKTYGIVHPGRAVRVRPRPAARADARVAGGARRRSSSRPPAGSGRSGTSRTPACSRSTATR